MQKLTREQFLAIYNAGPDAVIDLIEQLIESNQNLAQQVQSLQRRVSTLEEQLAQNSRNSNKPPSSDGLKRPTRTLRKASQRRVGGQKGHEGHTLKRVAHPNKTIRCTVEICHHCGKSLKSAPVQKYESRQVFDIRPVKLEVTEYQAEVKQCTHCNCLNQAAFPERVSQPVQYGSGLKAQLVYLMNQHLLPYERTAEIIYDIYGHRLSTGSLVNLNQTCYQALEVPEAVIKNQITNSKVVHFDETGGRVEVQTKWLHTASTRNFTWYGFHRRRGTGAMNDANIWPLFKGIAVHDHWKSYFNYDCQHALCNAHHLRELIFISEQKHQSWAQEMMVLLLEIKASVEKAREDGFDTLDKKLLTAFENKYSQILERGFEVNPEIDSRRKRKKRTKAQNLLHRLKNYPRETLAFMYDFDIPFDNNLAERDIRMVKVQQKISGCFRTSAGANIFCRIRGFISTAKKQNCNILQAIQSAMDGKPMLTYLMAE